MIDTETIPLAKTTHGKLLMFLFQKLGAGLFRTVHVVKWCYLAKMVNTGKIIGSSVSKTGHGVPKILYICDSYEKK
jgi:hypothetical protein